MAPSTETTGASKIILIRHAEKPEGTVGGVNYNGEPDSESLTAAGWQRAGALVVLLAPANGPLQNPQLATPAYLFASSSSSQRPVETIMALSEKLHLRIDTTFKKAQEKELADAARACDGVVLISWPHQDIPAIAGHLLQGSPDENNYPRQWPGDRFDVIWIFTLHPGTGKYSFSQLAQQLLAGDTPSVIPVGESE